MNWQGVPVITKTQFASETNDKQYDSLWRTWHNAPQYTMYYLYTVLFK